MKLQSVLGWSLARWGLLFVVVVFIGIQLVPYGRQHANPPVRSEPPWDSVETRSLAAKACFDCHSNETVWPWYTRVAPISWLITRNVEHGRDGLNYSEWNRPQKEARESGESVREGEMPPRDYLWLHPSARLSDSEKDRLVRGLEATFGSEDGESD